MERGSPGRERSLKEEVAEIFINGKNAVAVLRH